MLPTVAALGSLQSGRVTVQSRWHPAYDATSTKGTSSARGFQRARHTTCPCLLTNHPVNEDLSLHRLPYRVHGAEHSRAAGVTGKLFWRESLAQLHRDRPLQHRPEALAHRAGRLRLAVPDRREDLQHVGRVDLGDTPRLPVWAAGGIRASRTPCRLVAPAAGRSPAVGPWRRGPPVGGRLAGPPRAPSPDAHSAASSSPAPQSASPCLVRGVRCAARPEGLAEAQEPSRTTTVALLARHASRIGTCPSYLHTFSWIFSPRPGNRRLSRFSPSAVTGSKPVAETGS